MRKKRNKNEPTTDWRDLVTGDGLYAVDPQQRIVHWSESAQRIMGYEPDEVIGKQCYEIIAGKDSESHRFCRKKCPVMENARRGSPTEDFDILSILPSGEEKWLNISIAVPKGSGRDFQVIHMFRDVSQRHQTEEFARKASAALRDLLDEERPDATEGATIPSTPVPKLSRRELEVLKLLAAGLSTGQIASTLEVQPVTARNHITRLLNKLGVENRLQAVLYASQRGII